MSNSMQESNKTVGVEFEILNTRIERMQADRSFRDIGPWNSERMSEEVAMLQMAAHLNSLRPGADTPCPDFVSSLRARMLGAVESDH